MGKLLLIIGLAGLCHAAFSATQHRNFLRLTEHELSSILPTDILAQCIISLLLCCFGIVSLTAKFKPIQITSEWENKTWENIGNRTSFYSFNHRGKYLFSSENDQIYDEEEEGEESEDSHSEEIAQARQRATHQKPTQLKQQIETTTTSSSSDENSDQN